MTRVNLKVSTWHNNDDDGEDGPYSYRGTTSGIVEDVYIAESDYYYGYRGMETDLEPPFYVVYATYTDGNTFGFDFEASVVGIVKTEEEAIALRDEAAEKTGFGSLSNGYYVPWTGYFAGLESLSIRYLGGMSSTKYYS